MSTAAALPPSGLSWDQFLDLPDEPQYKHAELIDGKVVAMPANWMHQNAVGGAYAEIRAWARSGEGRGSVTMDPPVKIRDNRGYLPDVAWYREGRHRPQAGQLYLDGPPDLAIEVLSPSTRPVDMIRKRADYARVGVQELWLIDPEGPAALVLRRASEGPEFLLVEELDADGTLTSPMLPGLAIRVGDLFA